MSKFNLKESIELTFLFESSPFSYGEVINQILQSKELIVCSCYLMDIKVTNVMFGALTTNSLSKFFVEIEGITNEKAARIIDNTIAMWNAKEFGVKSDEFIGSIEDINTKLLNGK